MSPRSKDKRPTAWERLKGDPLNPPAKPHTFIVMDSLGGDPYTEMENLLQKLWTRAVGTPGYNKQDWKRFQQLIETRHRE